MEQHLQHDLELIAAYAEGLLADGDEARNLVEECAHCQQEYELQKGVKGLLAGLPQARLTDPERLELHAIIKRLPGGNVITLEDRRRTQRWMRIASVAAVSFVLIGLGAVFVGTMGGGSRASFSTTAGALGGNDSSAEAFVTTTAAAATTTALAQATDMQRLAGGDADAVRAEIDSLLLDESFLPAYSASPREEAAQGIQALCAAEVSDREVVQVAESRLDGRPIVIFIVATEDGREALIYDEATCVLVELPPE
jgi:hypothetical protein